MSRQLIEYSDKGGELFMNRKNALPAETLAIFDLSEVFPLLHCNNPVQRYYIIYGIKKSLQDAGASEPTVEGKVKAARARWKLSCEGKLKATKVSAASKAKAFDAILAIKDPQERLKALAAYESQF